MEAKEDIRSRLNIEDVVGQYVQLKRAGRNFKGLSPFSHEKTASFMVSPEKHIWHDFSSGKGGDIFTFIMEVEGVDFKGAMELLARRAGVDLSQYRGQGGGENTRKKEAIFSTLELAAKYYQQALVASRKAQEYVFKKRKFTKQTVLDFKIGYAPAAGGVAQAVHKKGVDQATIVAAGLLSPGRGIGGWEVFRDRMMIPLADPQGRVVGFTSRIIDDDPKAPKYINTPQTLVYDKSRNVFGLHMAKEAIRARDFVVIVEGNLDVVMSHQAGVKNVVATAGTAITEYHLRTLSRFTQDVRLAFDSDNAGVAATERAIGLASNLGINLGIITVEGAKDADELIQQGVDKWEDAIAAPKDAIEWLLLTYAKQYDVNSAVGKRRLTDRVIGIIRNIDDPVLVEHYLGVVARFIQSSVEALNKKLTLQPQPNRPEQRPVVEEAKQPLDDNDQLQDHLLALAWAHLPLRDSLRKLEAAEFNGETRQAVAAHLLDDSPLLQSDAIRVKIGELELIAETKYPVQSDELYFIAADIAKRIKKEYKQRLRLQLARQFAASDDEQERKSLNGQIKQLDQDIEALKH
jgi:DNA primase